MATPVYEPYSVGVLTTDIVNGNNVASVWPHEKVPVMPKKEIVSTYFDNDQYGQFTHKGVDSQGRSYEANVKADTSMRAKFLSDDRNQISIPLLRQGERVMLYRLKGSDEFYWKPLNSDGRLAESDSVVKAYAATNKDEPGGYEGDPEKAYITSISPANKEISIVTSQANGEPCGYFIQVNTKEGAVVVQDTLGNIIQMDSVGHRITLRNADDTLIDLNRQDIKVHCLGNAEFKIGGNLVWDIAGNKEVKIGGNLKEDVGGNSEVNCPEMKTTSNHIGVSCPTTDYEGMVNMGGMSTTGSGGDGNAKLSGGLTAQNDVVGSGVSLATHHHIEQGDGRPTSPPQ